MIMADKKIGREKLHCSFCGKEQDAVKRLVAGPGVYICDECIDICNSILLEEEQRAGEHDRITGQFRQDHRHAGIGHVGESDVLNQDQRVLATRVFGEGSVCHLRTP